jgi:hypothetical protein
VQLAPSIRAEWLFAIPGPMTYVVCMLIFSVFLSFYIYIHVE